MLPFNPSPSLTLSPHFRRTLAASAAAVAYGLWAFAVNRDDGLSSALNAAVAQGGYSFLLTLTLALLIEHLQRLFGTSIAALIATVGLTCILLFGIAFVLQWYIGTVDVLVTILPGWVIGSLYAAACIALGRAGRA